MTTEMETDEMGFFDEDVDTNKKLSADEIADLLKQDKQKLGQLVFGLLAAALIDALTNPETRMDSATLNAGMRWLKENDIEVDPARPGSKAPEATASKLPFKLAGDG